jgi:hypothetical protein
MVLYNGVIEFCGDVFEEPSTLSWLYDFMVMMQGDIINNAPRYIQMIPVYP